MMSPAKIAGAACVMSAAREEKRLRNKIHEALLTDEAMVCILDDLFGRENYAYDPQNDVWVTPDRDHDGPGRFFIVVQRGGDWRKVVIPAAVLQ
jgi:hypothetical protein